MNGLDLIIIGLGLDIVGAFLIILPFFKIIKQLDPLIDVIETIQTMIHILAHCISNIMKDDLNENYINKRLDENSDFLEKFKQSTNKKQENELAVIALGFVFLVTGFIFQMMGNLVNIH